MSGNFNVIMRVVATETFAYPSLPTMTLPTGWQLQSVTASKVATTITKGDSVDFTFTISHPSILPFFPKDIEGVLQVQAANTPAPVQALITTALIIEYEIVKARGKVYFTPYNSVEIWSEGDFFQLRRTWIGTGGSLDTTRIFIAKSSIPVTNITQNDSITVDWQDDLQLKFVRGLAYLVQMRAVDPAIIDAETTEDGLDSAYDDGTSVQSVQNSLISLGRTFSGTVRGRLISPYLNDVGVRMNIPLAGLLVKLKESDKIYDQEFGEATTDANGNFTINFSRWQTNFEGRNIELYIKVKSKNQTFNIKVKDQGILGESYEFFGNVGSFGTSTNAFVTHRLDGEPWRLLHWTFRAWEHFNASGFPLCQDPSLGFDNALSVIPFRNNSYFLPDGLLGIQIPQFHPTIRLENGRGNNERTIRHEFGHYVMWCVQGKNWALTPSLETSHSWENESHTRLAWTEGWAAAVEMILDGVFFNEDQEYGFDDNNRSFENRELFNNINNGVNSEYNIATAIYDLWDGPSRGLPLTFLGANETVGTNDLSNPNAALTHWRHADNIEMSLSQIVMPIATGSVIGMPSTIYEYFTKLVNNTSNCTLRRIISDCFAQNRVVFDVGAFDVGLQNSGMDTDVIANSYSEVFPEPPLQPAYTDWININPYFVNGIQNFNFFLPASGISSLTDDLDLNGTGLTGTHTVSLNPSLGNIASGTYSTCGIAVNVTNAELILGGASTSARLEILSPSVIHLFAGSRVTINNNSVLYIGCGATLIIEPGASFTLNGANAKVIIDGTLQVMPGATFTVPISATTPLITGLATVPQLGSIYSVNLLNAPSYTWTVPSGWKINGLTQTSLTIIGATGSSVSIQPSTCGVSGAISVTVSNCVNSSVSKSLTAEPCKEALNFDGSSDFVNIPEKNGRLNLGTGSFVMEAYVKSTATGGIRTLISKRTFVSGSVSDGFLFGILTNGVPFLQLKGAPNITPATGTVNLYDGNCHHVAVRRNGTTLSFFIDGNFLGFGNATSSRDISSTGPLRIATDPVTTNAFGGWIGEIRVWNISRTDNLISSNVGASLIPQTGLMGFYDMNDNGGQVLTDLSTTVTATKNNGTLGSGTSIDTSDPVWLSSLQVTCRVQGNFRESSQQVSYGIEADSVSSITENNYISFFPNPSSDIFYLKVNSHSPYNIKIKAVEGSQLLSLNSLLPGTEYPLGADLPQGLYILIVEEDKRRSIIKLIKRDRQ